MMRASIGRAPLLLAVAALCAAALPSGAPDAPMTDEDVVRMVVAGATEEQVLREIERREPAFDVSAEMLEELRRVRVPEAVIAAMLRRQQEAEAGEHAAGGGTQPAPVPAQPVLRVRINPERPPDKPSILRVRKEVDPQLAAEWELGNAPHERTFSGIALYLACVTADHVPHEWRSKSPLGRDFISTVRHEMLAFEAVAAAGDRAQDHLEMELPRSIEALLEPGETHDVVLGVALQIADRYYNWISDTSPGVLVGPEGVTLAATVKGRGMGSMKVAFLRPADE
jgi:hypothetical protein